MSERPIDREDLKGLFANGRRPTGENFESLIDSMVNKVDDRISKNLEDGLMLAPEGEKYSRLLSFYDDINKSSPRWSIEMPTDGNGGLAFAEPESQTESNTIMYFQKGGNIGIGTEEPKTDLDVQGILGTSARIGTHKMGTVPADGKWHPILEDLDGCVAFEVIAMVGGKEKTGKYALLHATALSTFGNSRNRIRRTQAHYGWWWHKLSLKWEGSTNKYSLKLRTRSDYGSNGGSKYEIKYCITRLWDNDILSLFDKEPVTKEQGDGNQADAKQAYEEQTNEKSTQDASGTK